MKKSLRQYAGLFLIVAGVVACAQTLQAAEAVRLYLELTDNETTILPVEQGADYLRGRVLILDGENNLATEFNGMPLESSELILRSSFGDAVRFSSDPATTVAASVNWETAATSLSFDVQAGWQEFAVRYDSAFGDDTITATLRQGTTTISADAEVTVTAPLANCYVVRTGGLLSLNVLDEIPSRTEDGGSASKLNGDSTTVDVYAAFYYQDSEGDDHYIYTSNVPEGAGDVTVQGASETLSDEGTVRVSVAISSVTAGASAAIAPALFDAAFIETQTVTFSASAASSEVRWIGNQDGDVTADEYLNAVAEDSFPTVSGDYTQDVSYYRPKSLVDKILIVGLPINAVTSAGAHVETGLGAQDQAPGAAKISPNDAFKLLEDHTVQPASFRVPGDAGETTYIYGAIIGIDEDGDAAPFAQGLTATFYLKQKDDVALTGRLRAVNTGDADYYSGAGSGETLKAKYGYQCFLPFQITATAATADGSIASITSLYIDKIELYDGEGALQGEVDEEIYGQIDEEAEGVSFIAQDTVASIDLSDIANLNGESAGEDATVSITGKGDEDSFHLRVLDGDGSEIKIGPAGASEPVAGSLAIRTEEGNLAEREVAFFNFSTSGLFFFFSGDSERTQCVQYLDTAAYTFEAADPDDFTPAVSASSDEIRVLLDADEDHDTVLISGSSESDDRQFSASDPFDNVFDNLRDAKAQAAVYLAAADGSSTGTPFPGATVRVDDDGVRVVFDLAEITPAQDEAVVEVSNADGSSSDSVLLKLRAVTSVGFDRVFVPVPGVDDTPVELYLADQNGALIAPVTITAANDESGNSGAAGNTVEIELETDNGTVDGSNETTVELTTVVPSTILAADPDEKTRMEIAAKSKRYGETTLVLQFTPDFEKPIVSDVIASNCCVEISLQDNQAVDLDATVVQVLDSGGTDITADLDRANNPGDNGTTGTITLCGFPETSPGIPDDYTLNITVFDMWNNSRLVTRTASVACVERPKQCLSVDPSYVVIEDAGGLLTDVTIIGNNTSFGPDTTVSFSCPEAGVTVLGTAVDSATKVVVSVSITSTYEPVSNTLAVALPSVSAQASETDDGTGDDDSGDDGTGDDGGDSGGADSGNEVCEVTVIDDDGDEIACGESFEIIYGAVEPECLGVNPDTIDSGESTDIVITGNRFIGFDDQSTVVLDCAGVTVESVSAQSDTELLISVSSNPLSATVTCNVSVTTTEGTRDCGTLTVLPSSAPSVCSLARLTPASVRARMLPYVVTIQGSPECRFSRGDAIDFGTDDIRAVPFVRLSRRILCLVIVSPGTPAGDYPVTVGDAGGVSLTVR